MSACRKCLHLPTSVQAELLTRMTPQERKTGEAIVPNVLKDRSVNRYENKAAILRTVLARLTRSRTFKFCST